MRLVYAPWTTLLGLALLSASCRCDQVSKSEQHEPRPTTSIALPTSPEVCESRTVNYITHTLPQQCLRTSWVSPTPNTDSQSANAGDQPTSTISRPSSGPETSSGSSHSQESSEAPRNGGPGSDADAEQEEDGPEDLATSSFMSFEEWKEMMLRKSGQDPGDMKNRKSREHKGEREPGAGNNDLDSLGDDGEIALDFDALSDKVSEITAPAQAGDSSSSQISAEAREEKILYDDGKTQYYRSKDAGKTCKERFSYSSFDAGATVLKTSPDAKNAKAILVENKDSYMLMECHTKNKFVIVELSDDILIDTVVLANFEFFSSMIRNFRVSVSDRYPVKLDKWVELGTFEARNSRDIQAFLVEHPQIYTKYIRIEFLTHYGNEYYCPVSLLRVHGTRMLDAWKESESGRDEDEPDDVAERDPSESLADAKQGAEPITEPSNASYQDPQLSQQMELSPWNPIFQWEPSYEMCGMETPTTTGAASKRPPDDSQEIISTEIRGTTTTSHSPPPNTTHGTQTQPAPHPPVTESTPPLNVTPTGSPTSTSQSAPSTNSSTKGEASSSTTATGASTKQSASSVNSTEAGMSTPATKVTSGTQSAPKNRTGSSTAQSASPTVQESFFKTVSKRLQLLESNTSLSLQYIEEQSRFLQEALQKMEKKQIRRVDAFLDSLNKTVLTELRNVRYQYDQIWQSTVIALESQREQSQREIVALSSRLGVLADEVVFQKRMAILQSVLLLSCLILVIFSRGYVGNSLELALHQQQQQFSRSRGAFPASSSAPDLHSSSPPPFAATSETAHYHDLSASPSPDRGHLQPGAHFSSPSPSPSYTGPYNDKLLPLTPPSAVEDGERSRRSPGSPVTPTSQDQPLNGSLYESGGSGDEDNIPFEAESPGVGQVPSSSPRISEESVTVDNSRLHLTDAAPPERPSCRTNSNSSLVGSIRKPLPALPEDVPDDIS
ncbi:hypothetical protein VTK73DRAFT_683 [Phialemonium thermophilum]|uniref:SUN domain-containing protein n=1 Tax=Phialemonium thermophilum TaxID=223376 RepID=A0ABR3XE51_9PEZI